MSRPSCGAREGGRHPVIHAFLIQNSASLEARVEARPSRDLGLSASQLLSDGGRARGRINTKGATISASKRAAESIDQSSISAAVGLVSRPD